MGNRLVWILLGGTIFTGVALVVVLALIEKPLDHSIQNRQHFDRSIWMSYAHSEDRDNLRGAMANDVRDKLVRDRPSKEKVINMLGQPDSKLGEDVFVYRLGMWSNNRQTRDQMEIHFSEDIVSDIQFVAE